MTDPERIKVLIIEDHAMIAHGLRAAMEPFEDIDVVAVGSTLLEGEQLARGHDPDVVVLDFRLPDGEAPEGIRRLAKARPKARVLVVTAASDYRSVVRALEEGAAGYLLKDQPIDDLVAGIRGVAAGETVVAPTLLPRLLARVTPTAAPAAKLSRREIEVLQLLAEGLSTAELSERLHLSANTIRNHVQSILTRAGRAFEARGRVDRVARGDHQGTGNRPTQEGVDGLPDLVHLHLSGRPPPWLDGHMGMHPSEQIRSAVIIDDWGLVRLGVKALLANAGIRRVRTAATATAGLAGLEPDEVGLVCVGACADAALLDVVRRVHLRSHRMRIVALVGTIDQEEVISLFEAGANAVVPRRAQDEQQLAGALEHALAGERYLAPMLLTAMFGERQRPAVRRGTRCARLTGREQSVLELVAGGRTNREIAETLNIGAETVKTHLTNVYAKLDVRSRQQAVGAAISHGLI